MSTDRPRHEFFATRNRLAVLPEEFVIRTGGQAGALHAPDAHDPGETWCGIRMDNRRVDEAVARRMWNRMLCQNCFEDAVVEAWEADRE